MRIAFHGENQSTLIHTDRGRLEFTSDVYSARFIGFTWLSPGCLTISLLQECIFYA